MHYICKEGCNGVTDQEGATCQVESVHLESWPSNGEVVLKKKESKSFCKKI